MLAPFLKGEKTMNETIITMDEARAALRVDGTENDDFIEPLLISIPSYMQVATGYDWNKGTASEPLAKTAAKFILQLWFDPQTEDSVRLKRTVDSLLTSLTAIGKQRADG